MLRPRPGGIETPDMKTKAELEKTINQMLNLNASGLYLALSEPMYTACGITLR